MTRPKKAARRSGEAHGPGVGVGAADEGIVAGDGRQFQPQSEGSAQADPAPAAGGPEAPPSPTNTWTITLGSGRTNPRGQRLDLSGEPRDALAQAIAGHRGPEAWWAPSTWRDDHRAGDGWEGACAVVLDLDTDGHVAIDPALARRVIAALDDLANLAHGTPHGVRAALMLEVPAIDAAEYQRACLGAAELVRVALAEAGVEGLTVDPKPLRDLARMFWTPQARVECSRPGHDCEPQRVAEVELLRSEPWSIKDLVEAAPTVPASGQREAKSPPPRKPLPPPPTRSTTPYGRRALEDESRRVAGAPEGERNDALNRAAFALGQLVAGQEVALNDAETALRAAGRLAGLEERETEATLRSGLQAGAAQPRRAPQRAEAPTGSARTRITGAKAPPNRWPAPMHEAAFCGLAGDFVRLLAPHTEAGREALLVQFLVAFGSAVGRGPHCMADGAEHHANAFAVVVGPTSAGRKGTSAKRALEPIQLADETWRVERGLVSGEGLIHAVRDPRFELEKSKGTGQAKSKKSKAKKGRRQEVQPVPEPQSAPGLIEHTCALSGGEPKGAPWSCLACEAEANSRRGVDLSPFLAPEGHVLADPGVEDKRLGVYESEFVSVLQAGGRQGNTLSSVLRSAWDGDDLGTLAKNSRERATKPHVSVIGHITEPELRENLDRTEIANGLGNRFLWIMTRRSKVLPDGGTVPEERLAALVERIRERIVLARKRGLLIRDEEARALWHEVYEMLTEDRPGLVGELTARAAAQAIRLSLIFALLDGADRIRREHLEAALAVLGYVERSATYIFGDALGNPTADSVLRILRAAGDEGRTRRELHEALGGHVPGSKLGKALNELAERGLAYATEQRNTGGRPAERWCAREPRCEQTELSEQSSSGGPAGVGFARFIRFARTAASGVPDGSVIAAGGERVDPRTGEVLQEPDGGDETRPEGRDGAA